MKFMKIATMIIFSLVVLACPFFKGNKAMATDEYDAIRAKWEVWLTGGHYDDDPDISAYVSNLIYRVTNTNNSGYWDKMNKSTNRSYLWSDLSSTTISSQITSNYSRLSDMALVYSMEKSPYYHNVQLKDDIIGGLEWMYVNRYNENIQVEYDNWWEWEIGTPVILNNIIVLMFDQLQSGQITNYINVIDRFCPDPTKNTKFRLVETGSNRVNKAQIVALRGIIGKNSEKIVQAQSSLSPEFLNVTTGPGFYADGSYIYHDRNPYNGTYGSVFMDQMTSVMYLLNGSSWEITDPNVNNVYKWVTDAFEPLIYKGAMMDSVRGRTISRVTEDHQIGRATLLPILRLAQSAPPDIALRIKRMVKYWIQSDTSFANYYSGNPNVLGGNINISDVIAAKALVKDNSIVPREELVLNKPYPSMDRFVHLRPEFGYAIAMSSNRIYNYTSINGENLKGWHTGEGMTYLYNNDLNQFADLFWPTVDKHRLPGTTSDGATRKPDYRSSKTWVGGSSIDDLYGVAGMELEAGPDHNGVVSTLMGKKSWFMFDDEIAALGTGISSTDNRKVETIVENRKLNASGNNLLTVNGQAKSSLVGWSEAMSGVTWAHLTGNVQGSDIGYYFPDSSSIDGLRETRTGSWSDISTSGSTTSVSRNYLSLAFNHGTNPTNASYSYVVLPNKDATATANYSSNPDITILSNTSIVQAVYEKNLGLTAANFWNAGSVGSITSYNPASVIVKETGDELTISASDPTQTQSKITIEIAKDGYALQDKDTTVTVVSTSPTLKVEIDVSGSMGKTHKVTFKK